MHQARSSEVASAQASALPHRTGRPATVEVYDLELRPVEFGAEDYGSGSGAGTLFPGHLPVPATDLSGDPRPECPAVAHRLIHAASTLRQRQCWDQAGHQALLAAWVCDDAGAARRIRRQDQRRCREVCAGTRPPSIVFHTQPDRAELEVVHLHRGGMTGSMGQGAGLGGGDF